MSRLPLSLSTVASLMLALQSPMSMAKGTRFSPKGLEAFRNDTTITHLSRDQIQSILSVRNAKGESFFGTKAGANPDTRWATKDAKLDGVQGTSTDKAYNEFGAPKGELIVAVIDSGVDIKQEDLKDIIWVNDKEIPNNGIDDDGDGFIDDVNGWNFLGTKQGDKIINIEANTLGGTRELDRLKKAGVAESDPYRKELQAYVDDKKAEADMFLGIYQALAAAADILETKAGFSPYQELTGEVLAGIKSTDPDVLKAIATFSQFVDPDSEYATNLKGFEEAYRQLSFQKSIQANDEKVYDSSKIVGDDPTQLQPVCASASVNNAPGCLKVSYGNNDVSGRNSKGEVMDLHGTHVAGIIAAIRNNGIGIDGQAPVKIMPIRAVPNGDERDKDIANAIRFAVDHGAKVINGSFGKAYPDNKKWVDDAIKYAESKGVIFVHAAGNDHNDTQLSAHKPGTFASNYPNRNFYDDNGKLIGRAKNWIEVGASSAFIESTLSNGSKVHRFAASFSNYGKTSVDLFAPGTKILSTAPGGYIVEQGTSMASPEVAGVTALVWAHFPTYDYETIKRAVVKNVTKYGNDVVTVLPGEKDRETTDATGKKSIKKAKEVAFNSLSASGGVANAYNAIYALKHPTIKQAEQSRKVRKPAQRN